MPVTNYIWDPENDNVLMETDESDVTQGVYTNEPDEFGNLISQRRSSVTSTYHYDALGSTRELTGSTENTTDTYVYTAFGEPVATSGTTINRFRFGGERGYYFDTETDDYYIRARTYQPTIARWTSTDPLEYLQEENLYLYVGNRPTVFVDPYGLCKVCVSGIRYRVSIAALDSFQVGPPYKTMADFAVTSLTAC